MQIRPIATAAAALLPLLFRSALHAAVSSPIWSAWSTGINGKFVTAAVFGNGNAYAASEDLGLWMLDAQQGQWTKLAPPDVKDDSVRCLAVDAQGRLWAGYTYHGVSIYNGKDWKTFDAPDGPLGHHIFKIAISPLDNDVWLATDLGLTRYSVANDTWSHITRADGLPADQISCLAFDKDGTLYVGTQCDGLAVANHTDNYSTWTTTTGPDRATLDVSGKGLPSSLINDLAIAADGSAFAATDGGLAVTRDHATTWTYYRGHDFLDKVQQRTGDAPDDWSPPLEDPLLSEDYSTTLAIDPIGRLWVGHRNAAVDLLDTKTLKQIDRGLPDALNAGSYVRCLLPDDRAGVWAGTYGKGLIWFPATASERAPDLAPNPAPQTVLAPLPSTASITPKQFDTLQKQLADAKPSTLKAAYLADDWVTRGDGVGRYGQQKQFLPFYGTGGWAQDYDLKAEVGPHQKNGGPYYYFHNTSSDDPRTLYIPNDFKRLQGEYNDGSFDQKSYPPTYDGPDLWLHVTLPADGIHRLTLFFINPDGHRRSDSMRDFLLEIKDGALSKEDADFAPPLARARVCDFFEPVYKQFVLAGGNSYWVKIGRNYSFVAKFSAALLDRLQGTPKRDIDSLPFPLLDADHWGPPKPPAISSDDPLPVRLAQSMWNDLDQRYNSTAAIPLQFPLRLQAYALAAQNGANKDLLENWRWHLHLWNTDERLTFCQQMDAGYTKTSQSNPQVQSKDRKSMVDLYKLHPY
jgi:hypothetical protein